MHDDFDQIEDYRRATMRTRDAILGVIVIHLTVMIVLYLL